MLSVCFGIMGAVEKATEFFGGSYVEALREEKHEEWGVNYCQHQARLSGPTIDLNLHPIHNISTFKVPYESTDSVAKIIGYTHVYLTPREAEYISEREEDHNWGNEHTVQVMRFIRAQQILRAQTYNAGRNG